MANFFRPALADQITRVQNQIASNLPGITPQLRRSTVQVLAMAVAMECQQEYAYLDNIVDWSFVQTAPGIYLDRKGVPFNLPRNMGSPADITITFTGTNTSTIPAGTLIQSIDNSLAFTLDSLVTISGTTGTGTATCTSVGSAGNLAPGVSLQIGIAIGGVQAGCVVASVATAGTDRETDTAYRARILFRMQNPPQGGSGNDYVQWAKQLAGVTRAWCFPTISGGGTVGVAFVFDARGPASSAIIPTSGDITNMDNLLVQLMPVEDAPGVDAFALTADIIAVTIGNLTPAAGYTKAQALANATISLTALFSSTTPGGAKFGDGVPWGTTGGSLQQQQISDAITQSAGVAGFDLTAPTADISSATGHIALLGAVTAP